MDMDNIVTSLKIFNPMKVILFGSFAYGIPTVNSDIDLLVVIDTKKSFMKEYKKSGLFYLEIRQLI